MSSNAVFRDVLAMFAHSCISYWWLVKDSIFHFQMGIFIELETIRSHVKVIMKNYHFEVENSFPKFSRFFQKILFAQALHQPY